MEPDFNCRAAARAFAIHYGGVVASKQRIHPHTYFTIIRPLVKKFLSDIPPDTLLKSNNYRSETKALIVPLIHETKEFACMSVHRGYSCFGLSDKLVETFSEIATFSVAPSSVYQEIEPRNDLGFDYEQLGSFIPGTLRKRYASPVKRRFFLRQVQPHGLNTKRWRLIETITRMMCEFVLFHERAHLLCGHEDMKREYKEILSNGFVDPPDFSVETVEYHRFMCGMEFAADMEAVTHFLSKTNLETYEPMREFIEIDHVQLVSIAIFSVFLFFYWLIWRNALKSGNAFFTFGNSKSLHPHSLLRYCSVRHVLNIMRKNDPHDDEWLRSGKSQIEWDDDADGTGRTLEYFPRDIFEEAYMSFQEQRAELASQIIPFAAPDNFTSRIPEELEAEIKRIAHPFSLRKTINFRYQ